MYCKNCGVQMNENQVVCLKCGVNKGQGSSFCPNCGVRTVPGADVCTSCGVSLKAGSLNGQDKIVMILVCLFLGGFGIHNFMMGESKKGIFKIIMSLLCGIGGILALIDLVKICLDKYTVEPDKIF